jgi:hypothetical protein
MKTTTKILTTGAAVAILGAMGAYAFAQQGPGFGPGMMGMRHGMMMGGGQGPMMGRGIMGGFADPAERLEAVKKEIGIKPEQQAAWDAYSKTVQETAAALQKQRREGPERVKTAAETLLGTLDDAQKAKAGEILPGVAGPGPGMRHGMMGGQGMGHRMMGHGMGPGWNR